MRMMRATWFTGMEVDMARATRPRAATARKGSMFPKLSAASRQQPHPKAKTLRFEAA